MIVYMGECVFECERGSRVCAWCMWMSVCTNVRGVLECVRGVFAKIEGHNKNKTCILLHIAVCVLWNIQKINTLLIYFSKTLIHFGSKAFVGRLNLMRSMLKKKPILNQNMFQIKKTKMKWNEIDLRKSVILFLHLYLFLAHPLVNFYNNTASIRYI